MLDDISASPSLLQELLITVLFMMSYLVSGGRYMHAR